MDDKIDFVETFPKENNIMIKTMGIKENKDKKYMIKFVKEK